MRLLRAKCGSARRTSASRPASWSELKDPRLTARVLQRVVEHNAVDRDEPAKGDTFLMFLVEIVLEVHARPHLVPKLTTVHPVAPGSTTRDRLTHGGTDLPILSRRFRGPGQILHQVPLTYG